MLWCNLHFNRIFWRNSCFYAIFWWNKRFHWDSFHKIYAFRYPIWNSRFSQSFSQIRIFLRLCDAIRVFIAIYWRNLHFYRDPMTKFTSLSLSHDEIYFIAIWRWNLLFYRSKFVFFPRNFDENCVLARSFDEIYGSSTIV